MKTVASHKKTTVLASALALSLSAAPTMALTYGGRTTSYDDTTQQWLNDAKTRINQYRKADLWVNVHDVNNNPIVGATVRVRMKQHEFPFGSAVEAHNLNTNPVYRDKFKSLFNKAVFEGEMKWLQWETPTVRTKMNTALDWLTANEIPVRGHNLIWPGWNWMPSGSSSLSDVALKERIKSHIQEEAGALKGKITDWDVMNEPYTNHDAMDRLGDYEMVRWFRYANEADPNAKLYINDFDALENSQPAHRDAYYNTIDYMLNRVSTPVILHGIGFQSHFNSASPPGMTGADGIYGRLQRFAAFGKDMMITEFDMDQSDEQLQADYTRDFMTMCFSHPQMKGFMVWGFWEGRHWIPRAAMYRTDWSEKPNGYQWRNLVKTRWWTNADLTSRSDGWCNVRGFKGKYEISVTYNGQTKTVTENLSGTGKSVYFYF